MHWQMPMQRKDRHATARWVAAELQRIGYGAQSELARRLDLPPSAISNIVHLKRDISADELEIIRDFIDERLGDAGRRPSKARRVAATTVVPVVGYVTAGGQEHRLPLAAGEFDEVEAPENVTDKTVAVQIRGKSLGETFDRWFAFYDDVRAPITPDLIGKLCVVGLADGRVVIKRVKQGRSPGRYNLYSENDRPILDVQIEWAARVKSLATR